jgi:putative heme iron utilization protein
MKDDGWPYASLVMMACDGAANPLLMISKLAVHTQNILTENRVSLLIDGTDGLDNPLTGARVTLVGHAEKTSDTDDLARYIARHPDSAMYADFADFALYRLDVERVHMVAGFGAIHWIEKAAYAVDMAFANNLKAAEPDIVCHMNEDHADALQLYATSLLGQAGAGWIMTGIDPEGCDLRCGGTVARLVFDTPVGTTEEARATLVALAGKARETG